MELNEKKTKSIIFNFSRNYQFKSNLILKKQKVEVINETKLLGLIITSDLHWDKNVDYLVKDARCKFPLTRDRSMSKKLLVLCIKF